MGKKQKTYDLRELHKKKPKKKRLQVCALCYRHSAEDGLQFYLVTSRRTKRWIAPKGWPMKKHTHAQAAAIEAEEEAGVLGQISERSVGFFTYDKAMENGKSVPLTVQVFPLEVTKKLKDYTEKGQRQRRWFSARKAAKRATPPEFARIIRKFARQNAEPSA